VLIGIAQGLYRDEPLAIELKQPLYAFDSTTLDLCLSLFPWAEFRRREEKNEMPNFNEKKNRWIASVMLRGERRQKLFPPNQKKKALAWEKAMAEELLQEQSAPPPQPGEMELREFFSLYLDHSKLHFSRKTFLEKQLLLQVLSKRWGGGTPVQDVTPAMIEAYLQDRATEPPLSNVDENGKKKKARVASNNAANKDRKNLIALWNWGIKIHNLSTDPVKTEKLPCNHELEYIPSERDMVAVLDAGTLEEKVFLLSYIDTGARRGEIFRWTWANDVNFEKKLVRLGTKKTRGGTMRYDWLPMSNGLWQALWWWKNNRPDDVKDSPFVFVSLQTGNKGNKGRHYGKPFKYRRSFMNSICKRAGVKCFGFHAIRRYAATILNDKFQAPLPVVQRFLRHASPSTTDRYIGMIHSDLAAFVEQLGSDHEANFTSNLLPPPSLSPQSE